MVKKLFKYEFKAYARTLLPMQGVLVLVALLNRFIQIFENDDVSYSIIFNSSVAALVISMLFLAAFTVIFGITRYYKTMFTHEGYLTLTLPVAPGQHLLVKLVTLFTFTLVTVAAMLVSGCVATFGDMFIELCRAIGYLVNHAFILHGIHLVFYFAEVVVIFAVVILMNYLSFYACMTLGQTARKNRVLCAFGIYFGYYFASQMIATVLMIWLASLTQSGALDGIISFSYSHTYAFFHIILCSVIVVMSALAAGFFALTNHVLKNKLNLE